MELPAYSNGVCDETIVAMRANDTDLHYYDSTTSTAELCCSYGISQGDASSDLISACTQTRLNFIWDDATEACTADVEAANPDDASSPFPVESSAS